MLGVKVKNGKGQKKTRDLLSISSCQGSRATERSQIPKQAQSLNNFPLRSPLLKVHLAGYDNLLTIP